MAPGEALTLKGTERLMHGPGVQLLPHLQHADEGRDGAEGAYLEVGDEIGGPQAHSLLQGLQAPESSVCYCLSLCLTALKEPIWKLGMKFMGPRRTPSLNANKCHTTVCASIRPS
eukprot:377895-Pelagomonas_calceolata.AAC.4